MKNTEPLRRVRRLLLVTFFLTTLGAGAELLLVGHTEETWQLVPLGLLGAAVVMTLWQLPFGGPNPDPTFSMMTSIVKR